MSLRVLTGSFALSLSLVLSTPTLYALDASDDEFVRLIVKLIGDKDPEFRAAGLEKVRTFARNSELTTRFAAELTKLDAGGQIALLNALADRGDRAARPAVLELVASSKDEGVRATGIAALGSLGTPDDLPLLVKTLAAESELDRSAAHVCLTRIPGETINKSLAEASQSASPQVRAALIYVLATRRARDVSPTLMAATVDDNAQVRSAAMSALGQIGLPEQIPQMLPGVLKAEQGAERDDAERNVARICGRIADETERGVVMVEALNGIEVAARDDLLSLAGRVGGKQLIDFVADIARDEDKARRRIGIDALGKWPNASVADILLEIANAAGDSAERKQAFQGFVKVSASRDDRPDKERLERMKQAMQAAKTPEETRTVINRTRTAYDVESLRFVLPYVDQPRFAQIACETIVEIAHHREVRDPNKAEVDKMLDKVIATSKDAVVVDRANRYKRGETWTRPASKERS